MKRLWSILLLGALSMFFAEVFSGASTLWFVDAWGLFLTFPLYLGHAIFFLNVAFLWKKTSPRQLYFFGMMFGLYEALITKVLWFGYPNSSGPAVGYFFGIAWSEFLTLVLFYHPIMSFVIPVFVYELLSGDVLPGHEWFLEKNWKTFFLIILLIMMGASFQSNGAQYDVIRSMGSMGGSILIILVLHVLSKGKNLQSLVLGKKALIIVVIYLFVLYGVTTVIIFPNRLPGMFLPYMLIFLWYLVALGLLWFDKFTPISQTIKGTIFSQNELGFFAILLVCATIVCSVFQQITYDVLLVMFVSLMGVGVVLFFWSIFSMGKQKIFFSKTEC
jgi:hypothetical protein